MVRDYRKAKKAGSPLKRLKINEITNININLSNTMGLMNSTLDFLHET